MSLRAVLSLSGGLDSSTLLAHILSSESGFSPRCEPQEVLAVNFYYGSKHNDRECKASQEVAEHYGVNWKYVNLSDQMRDLKSTLMKGGGELPEGHYTDESMKSTVVPGRNLIFLSFLASVAESEGAPHVFLGVHAGDRCIPADVPVATMRGMIPIEDIVPGEDQVMSFDPESKRVVWRKVVQLKETGNPSEVLRITTKSGAVLRCTPEHQVYVVDRPKFSVSTGYTKVLTKTPAGELGIGDMLLIAGDEIDVTPKELGDVDLLGLIDGNPMYDRSHIWYQQTNKVNRFVPIDEVLRLTAWYVTEGYPASGNVNRPNTCGVYIAQSSKVNLANLEEIQRVAATWGFRTSVHGKSKDTSVYFSGPTGRALLNCGRKSRQKKLPEWMLPLHNDRLRVLFDVMIAGDGHVPDDDRDRMNYITTSRHLMRQMSYIGNRLGYRVSVLKMINTDCLSVNLSKPSERKNLNRYGGAAMTPIARIEKIPNQSLVYDIGVEGTHNFFAGDTVPILVSNSIYPDCRPDFIESASRAIHASTDAKVGVRAPFLYLDKSHIVKAGLRLKVPFSKTWTCYQGRQYACGLCGACVERLGAFAENGAEDPILYQERKRDVAADTDAR